MHPIKFLESGRDISLALPGSYDPLLVTLSILIACLAAYPVLSLAGRISAAERPTTQSLWLVAGAATMGIGVWAMHFIGMLAFRLPIPVSYDVQITLLSMTPAIVASGIMLCVISRGKVGRMRVMVVGTLMGAGIGTMHYVGMAAMRMAATMRYHTGLFILSIIVAVLLAIAALYINMRANNAGKAFGGMRISAALVLGLAVAAMHYTGMAAAYFFPANLPGPSGGTLDPIFLSVLISLAAVVILSLAIFAATVDTRLKAAAQSVRLSRARLIEAIESISEGFSLYDADDRLILCNSKYRRFLYSDEKEITPGLTFEQVIRMAAERGLVPDAVNDLEGWIEQRLARHRAPTGPFIERQSDDRWLQINEHKTDDGGTVAVYTDITEIKQTALKLQQAYDALHEKNYELHQAFEELKATQNQLIESAKMASLGRLTAGIAHEINNPMGALNSTMETLIRCVTKMKQILDAGAGTTDDRRMSELQKLLQILERNSQVVFSSNDRIATVINSLKNFTRLDEAEFKEVDLHEGIDSTLVLLRHDMGSDISVSKKYGYVPRIQCYAGELNQVFMTLLRNAIEAIESGGTITIITTTSDDKVEVKISDNGKGISQMELETLFDFRFAAKDSRIGVKTGLFNVYNTVQKHNGEIKVESDVGQGTTVTIFLPVDGHPHP